MTVGNPTMTAARTAVAVEPATITAGRSTMTVGRVTMTVVRSTMTVARTTVTVVRATVAVGYATMRVVRTTTTVVRTTMTAAQSGLQIMAASRPAPGSVVAPKPDFETSKVRALARLKHGYDLDWTPPVSRDELHDR